MSLAELQEYMATVRTSVHKMLDRMVTEKVAQYAVEIIDHGTCRGKQLQPDERKRPLSYARRHVEERYREVERTQLRDSEVDFSFSLTVMAGKNKTLAILFTEQEKFRKLWESQPGVKEFSYWDNADQPKGISDSQWRARGEEWDAAMPLDFTPAQNGFTVEFIPRFLPQRDAKGHLKFVPKPERRVTEQVEQQMFDRYATEKGIKAGQNTEIVSGYSKFRKWLKTPVGQKKWKAAVKRATAKLKMDLTVVDLLGWDPAKR